MIDRQHMDQARQVAQVVLELQSLASLQGVSRETIYFTQWPQESDQLEPIEEMEFIDWLPTEFLKRFQTMPLFQQFQNTTQVEEFLRLTDVSAQMVLLSNDVIETTIQGTPKSVPEALENAVTTLTEEELMFEWETSNDKAMLIVNLPKVLLVRTYQRDNLSVEQQIELLGKFYSEFPFCFFVNDLIPLPITSDRVIEDARVLAYVYDSGQLETFQGFFFKDQLAEQGNATEALNQWIAENEEEIELGSEEVESEEASEFEEDFRSESEIEPEIESHVERDAVEQGKLVISELDILPFPEMCGNLNFMTMETFFSEDSDTTLQILFTDPMTGKPQPKVRCLPREDLLRWWDASKNAVMANWVPNDWQNPKINAKTGQGGHAGEKRFYKIPIDQDVYFTEDAMRLIRYGSQNRFIAIVDNPEQRMGNVRSEISAVGATHGSDADIKPTFWLLPLNNL